MILKHSSCSKSFINSIKFSISDEFSSSIHLFKWFFLNNVQEKSFDCENFEEIVNGCVSENFDDSENFLESENIIYSQKMPVFEK